jgi:hypothetical protein
VQPMNSPRSLGAAWEKECRVKARNQSRVAEAETHSEGITYKPQVGEIRMCLGAGRRGRLSEDGPGQRNSVRSEGL